MTLTIEAPATSLRLTDDGTVRVGNTRVTLEVVITAFQQGLHPEEIIQHFPTLELKDVYAAVTFYLYNPAAVEAYLAEQERQTAEIEQEIQARMESTDLYRRAMAIVAARES